MINKLSSRFIFFIVLSIISCKTKCHEDIEFKNFYFSKIDEIFIYDSSMSTKDFNYTQSYWLSFYQTTDYLELLTKHKFHFSLGEPPLYKNKSDLNADIIGLKKWYKKNKYGMTIQKADSIVQVRRLQMRKTQPIK